LASASKLGGNAIPSALRSLRLITISNRMYSSALPALSSALKCWDCYRPS
jgi:hypothetical protein